MLNIWRKNFIIRNSSIRFKQTYLLTSIDIHVVLKKKKKAKQNCLRHIILQPIYFLDKKMLFLLSYMQE